MARLHWMRMLLVFMAYLLIAGAQETQQSTDPGGGGVLATVPPNPDPGFVFTGQGSWNGTMIPHHLGMNGTSSALASASSAPVNSRLQRRKNFWGNVRKFGNQAKEIGGDLVEACFGGCGGAFCNIGGDSSKSTYGDTAEPQYRPYQPQQKDVGALGRLLAKDIKKVKAKNEKDRKNALKYSGSKQWSDKKQDMYSPKPISYGGTAEPQYRPYQTQQGDFGTLSRINENDVKKMGDRIEETRKNELQYSGGKHWDVIKPDMYRPFQGMKQGGLNYLQAAAPAPHNPSYGNHISGASGWRQAFGWKDKGKAEPLSLGTKALSSASSSSSGSILGYHNAFEQLPSSSNSDYGSISGISEADSWHTTRQSGHGSVDGGKAGKDWVNKKDSRIFTAENMSSNPTHAYVPGPWPAKDRPSIRMPTESKAEGNKLAIPDRLRTPYGSTSIAGGNGPVEIGHQATPKGSHGETHGPKPMKSNQSWFRPSTYERGESSKTGAARGNSHAFVSAAEREAALGPLSVPAPPSPPPRPYTPPFEPYTPSSVGIVDNLKPAPPPKLTPEQTLRQVYAENWSLESLTPPLVPIAHGSPPRKHLPGLRSKDNADDTIRARPPPPKLPDTFLAERPPAVLAAPPGWAAPPPAHAIPPSPPPPEPPLNTKAWYNKYVNIDGTFRPARTFRLNEEPPAPIFPERHTVPPSKYRNSQPKVLLPNADDDAFVNHWKDDDPLRKALAGAGITRPSSADEISGPSQPLGAGSPYRFPGLKNARNPSPPRPRGANPFRSSKDAAGPSYPLRRPSGATDTVIPPKNHVAGAAAKPIWCPPGAGNCSPPRPRGANPFRSKDAAGPAAGPSRQPDPKDKGKDNGKGKGHSLTKRDLSESEFSSAPGMTLETPGMIHQTPGMKHQMPDTTPETPSTRPDIALKMLHVAGLVFALACAIVLVLKIVRFRRREARWQRWPVEDIDLV